MRVYCLSLLLLLSTACLGLSDIYQFDSPQQQQQFNTITQQLRCLVCQNESLADSSAPLADDLRKQIADMVKQGASNKQIIHYLTDRYGQFVLYKPPFDSQTYLLWSLPFILLLVGLGLVLVLINKSRRFKN